MPAFHRRELESRLSWQPPDSTREATYCCMDRLVPPELFTREPTAPRISQRDVHDAHFFLLFFEYSSPLCAIIFFDFPYFFLLFCTLGLKRSYRTSRQGKKKTIVTPIYLYKEIPIFIDTYIIIIIYLLVSFILYLFFLSWRTR